MTAQTCQVSADNPQLEMFMVCDVCGGLCSISNAGVLVPPHRACKASIERWPTTQRTSHVPDTPSTPISATDRPALRAVR